MVNEYDEWIWCVTFENRSQKTFPLSLNNLLWGSQCLVIIREGPDVGRNWCFLSTTSITNSPIRASLLGSQLPAWGPGFRDPQFFFFFFFWFVLVLWLYLAVVGSYSWLCIPGLLLLLLRGPCNIRNWTRASHIQNTCLTLSLISDIWHLDWSLRRETAWHNHLLYA